MPINYGKFNQVSFADEHEQYFALGFLASAERTSIHWEYNDEQGAWGQEGRIHCYEDLHLFPNGLREFTEGTGNILARINCNDYVGELVTVYNFVLGRTMQDISAIRANVPTAYLADFDNGLAV